MNENMKIKYFDEELEVYDERRVVNKNTYSITLNYVPSPTRPLTVENGKTMLTETNGTPNANQYVLDRENGLLLFNQAMKGKVMTINYSAIGLWCISADKVYTNVDNKGKIVETLEDLMKENRQAIESIKTVGDASTVITQLQANIDSVTGLVGNIAEGSSVNEELAKSITSGKGTNTTLTNTISSANNKINEMNTWVNQHGDIVNLDNRVDTVETEIPKINEQLETIVREVNSPLRYGKLTPPSDFIQTLPCDFYRDNDGIIKHNMDFTKYKNGKKIYVLKNGNDNGDGSKSNPYATLTKALTVVNSGSETSYVIYTDIEMFKRDEVAFTDIITNKKISIISIAKKRTNEEVKSISLAVEDLKGSWNTTQYSGMPYAITEGDYLTSSFSGRSLTVKFYCDNRSGIFEIKLDGTNNSYVKTLDLYTTVAGNKTLEIFKDLEEDDYKLTLTYKGKSPNATESRGYIFLENFITYSNYDSELSTQSIISTNTTYSWTLESDNVYKTTRSAVMNVIDNKNRDIYGLPIPLLQVSSLEECKNTNGTWYANDTTVYVHRIDNLIPTFNNTIVNIGVTGFAPKLRNSTLYFENICFTGYGNSCYVGTSYGWELNTEVCVNKCSFVGLKSASNKGNGLAIENIYKTYVFDSISAYSQLDGFNYHYAGISAENRRKCLVVEYNCKGYDLGLIDIGNNSNQTSTAHEGCSILRIGTIAGNSSNSCIVDVNGCYSILYDCHVSNTRENSQGFVFSSDKDNSAKAMLVNCSSIDCKTSLSVEGANTSVEINNFKRDGDIIVNSGILE